MWRSGATSHTLSLLGFINVSSREVFMADIPAGDENFIIEKAVDGWDAELIGYALRNEEDSFIRDETVREFLSEEGTAERIEKEKKLIEKQAEVSREDLIRELNQQVEILRERSEELRESENDDIGNDTTKNLLKAVKDLAEMIDVLESKEDGGASNVVNVNKLEQNFNVTKVVEHLPADEKRSIAEQLEDDPDVEDFALVKK